MKPQLKKSLFWDIDYNTLDYEKNARFIIARVMMRGNLNDFFELKKYYGLDKIKQEVVKVKYLDKLTFNFCQVLFKLNKEDFRCYNTRQSIQEHWNY